MQTANCLLALGGDRGNSVPKTGVTAAEIAVMMAIHGVDAVYDIEPLDDEVERSSRDEIARLRTLYSARDEDGKAIVEAVYPGRTPILHETIDDLELPEELFATESRVTAKSKPKGKAKPKAKPAPATETAKVENSADDLFDDDGDGEGVLS